MCCFKIQIINSNLNAQNLFKDPYLVKKNTQVTDQFNSGVLAELLKLVVQGPWVLIKMWDETGEDGVQCSNNSVHCA